METLKRLGNFIGWTLVLTLGAAFVLAVVWLSFGTAGAAPSDVANFRYGPATCESNQVFASGVYGKEQSGVIALQRKDASGTFRTIGDDGTEGRIDGQTYIGRGWVALERGQIFQVTHSVPVEDIADYRVVLAKGTDQLLGEERPVTVLAKFNSYRPSEGFCYETKIAK